MAFIKVQLSNEKQRFCYIKAGSIVHFAQIDSVDNPNIQEVIISTEKHNYIVSNPIEEIVKLMEFHTGFFSPEEAEAAYEKDKEKIDKAKKEMDELTKKSTQMMDVVIMLANQGQIVPNTTLIDSELLKYYFMFEGEPAKFVSITQETENIVEGDIQTVFTSQLYKSELVDRKTIKLFLDEKLTQPYEPKQTT